MNWLDYFRTRQQRAPSIAQPVPVGEPMKDLRAPLPEPQRKDTQRHRWDWYMETRRGRDWIMKERKG